MRTALPLAFVSLLGCAQDYEVIPSPVDVNPGDITECAFTRVEDTAFYRYDCNPVFSTTGEDWADSIRQTTFLVTEVLDHPFYQLWYTAVSEDDPEGFSLGYAVSADGTEWTPHQDNPLLDEPEDEDAWDRDAMDGMQVVWDPATRQYVMLYQGYNYDDQESWSLGVATSPDGKSWRRIASNPVMPLAASEAGIQWCWPLGLELGQVAGYTGYVAGGPGRSSKCQVYAINGSDENEWEPEDEPAFPVGADGQWDDEGYISLAIAELKQRSERHMFYVGFGEWLPHPDYDYIITASETFLGMATREGGEWVRQPTPIPVNMTPAGEVSAVAARTVGSRIHLWITDNYDGESAVGYFLYDPEAAALEDGGGE